MRLYMKSVLIYPFGKEVEPIVNHFKQLVNIYPVCLVGVNGWDDGSRSYYAEGEKIPLIYEFQEGYKCYKPEIIWFTDFNGELEFERDYLPFLTMAIADGKEIIVSTKLKKIINKHVTNSKIRYYREEAPSKKEGKVGDFLRQINTPVIYVCGLYDGIGKFELQLMISKELRERNISAVQIGTREEFVEFGIYNMPLYMMDDTVTDKKKVLMLNNYLKELEERRKPELIVLGVPGELYSPSPKYIAGCGFLAMDCFYATEPDALIVALPYKKYTQMDLIRIGEGIQRKFGVKVDAFVRTNKRLLGEETELRQKCTYLTIGEKDMEYIDFRNGCLFGLKERHIKAMMDVILSSLEGYGKIELI